MGKHQIGPGDLCRPLDPPTGGIVRLLHRARFVEQAWLCRNVTTHLISVIPATRLDFVPEAAPPLRTRTAAYRRAAR
jgi:hypothetical protein